MSFVALALAFLLVPLAQQTPPAQAPVQASGAPGAPVVKPYKINFPVADFTLPDPAGKEHALLLENPSKAVVLVFFSYRDPVSRRYVSVLNALQEKHKDALAIVLIDSNQDELVSGSGDALEPIRRYLAAEKVTLPFFIDRDNKVADDFRATANAQAFLLDANHIVRYVGGIDDDPRGELAKRQQPVTSWLGDAVALVLKGERPEHNQTSAAGRVIKRVAPGPGAPR